MTPCEPNSTPEPFDDAMLQDTFRHLVDTSQAPVDFRASVLEWAAQLPAPHAGWRHRWRDPQFWEAWRVTRVMAVVLAGVLLASVVGFGSQYWRAERVESALVQERLRHHQSQTELVHLRAEAATQGQVLERLQRQLDHVLSQPGIYSDDALLIHDRVAAGFETMQGEPIIAEGI